MSPKTKRTNRARSMSRTAAKEARAHAGRELRNFVADAPLADVYFIMDVIVNWNSLHCASEELGIAIAFSETIDDTIYEDEYVRLPRERADAVRRYIKGLESGTLVPMAEKDNVEAGSIHLPATIRLSEDERVHVARLVRLLREKYWVAELVRQILKVEAETAFRLRIADVRGLLDNFDTIEALASTARNLGANWSDHPILRAIREEWTEIDEYKDERSIRRLIDSARGSTNGQK